MFYMIYLSENDYLSLCDKLYVNGSGFILVCQNSLSFSPLP